MSHAALNPEQFSFTKATPKEMDPNRYHTVVYRPEGEQGHGVISWHHKTGRISNISVSSHLQRQGIATAVYGKAKEIAAETRGVRPPRHSADRTEAGEAWARSLGERLPKRVQ
jgi:GNAT superfamily N-acetyltransferase